jgi:RNA polymerase sigma factor (sigma-70 family)
MKPSGKQNTPVKLTETEIETLILEHRDMARKMTLAILRRYRMRLPLDEAVSLADMALVRAAQRYRPDLRTAFSSYAHFYMRDEVQKLLTQEIRSRRCEEEAMKVELVDSHSTASSPEDHLLHAEKMKLLKKKLAALDSSERTFLRSLAQNDFNVTATAEAMGFSRPYFARRKSRLVRLLGSSQEGTASGDSRRAA